MFSSNALPALKCEGDAARFAQEILPLLAPPLANLLRGIPAPLQSGLEEIRLRSGQPIILRSGLRELTLASTGETITDLAQG
ncbi:MAG: stage III sporulation protein AA, partial [Peptococcaceae bacterium]|nr:stage III sporulation protein AA [Peptococcaceae bacterium]